MKAIVEIPKYSNYKYEIDSKGKLTLDRVNTRLCPATYGYILNTLCEDGDALDCFILEPISEALHPLTKINVFPFAVFKVQDNNEEDDKLVVVLTEEQLNNDYTEELKQIEHYLSTYKKNIKINELSFDKDLIKQVINKSKRLKRNENL